MEIDITEFVAANDMAEFSASVAELGANAGRITWRNVRDHAMEHPLLAEDQIEEAREYFKGFGAWSDAERAAWTPTEVCALVAQYIAGDWRELESLCADDNGEVDWDKARELSEQGRIRGSIYRGDIEGSDGFGRIFYYLGD